jgi:hypothetical protein
VNASGVEIPTGSLIQLHPELEPSKESTFSFKDSVAKLEIIDAELTCHTKNNFSLCSTYFLNKKIEEQISTNLCSIEYNILAVW